MSTAALGATLVAGCGALHEAPVSNATANPNAAAAESANAYRATGEQARPAVRAPEKKTAKPRPTRSAKAKPTKKPKVEKKTVQAKPKTEPVARTSGVPAWVTVINWASTKLGHKYVWGGDGYNNPYDGFDCSGLMKAAYAKAGITLPRVANDQYGATRMHPKKSELRMGDLVFYGPTERGIHHVGLYVGRDDQGKQMMLHAPNSRSKIRFDRIDYMSDYYGATRIVP